MSIELREVTHIYSQGSAFERKALDHVNLTIEDGEFIALCGHTGCGKSTLVQHLNGLLQPTEGQVLINGEDINGENVNRKKLRQSVGLVFQYPEYQLFEETAEKDIAYGPKNMGLSADEISKRVKSAAKFVGLKPELLKKSPFELSGGEKRRVAIAGVIAMEPDILILDEPCAGLDPNGRDVLLAQIEAYHRQKENTVLLVSHSMEDISRIADKILVMNKGKVFAFDSTHSVFEKGDELEKIGLQIPQVTKILLELKRRGYSVSADIYSVEKAAEEIMKLKPKKTGILQKGGYNA